MAESVTREQMNAFEKSIREQFGISETALGNKIDENLRKVETEAAAQRAAAEKGFNEEQVRVNALASEEQQRVTILVDNIARQIQALDNGNMVKTMEAISQQDQRDDARSKQLIGMFKTEVESLMLKIKELEEKANWHSPMENQEQRLKE